MFSIFKKKNKDSLKPDSKEELELKCKLLIKRIGTIENALYLPTCSGMAKHMLERELVEARAELKSLSEKLRIEE